MSDRIVGLPGPQTRYSSSLTNIWFSDQGKMLLPGGMGILDGSESRDPLNSSYEFILRPGTLMGRITATGYWAPCFIGTLGSAYTSGGVTLTLADAAESVEALRAVGATGTTELIVIGAPTATGTVAATAATHSAIDVAAGTLTVTSLGADKTAGSLLAINDGRHVPLGILSKPDGVRVVDRLFQSVDQQLPQLCIGGCVDVSLIRNYPGVANTTLRAWIKAQLRAVGGPYVFNDDFITV